MSGVNVWATIAGHQQQQKQYDLYNELAAKKLAEDRRNRRRHRAHAGGSACDGRELPRTEVESRAIPGTTR